MIKRCLLSLGLAAMAVPALFAQPSPLFRNDTVLTIPGDEHILQVDALNFLNNGTIRILFTNLDFLPLYDTSDTLNFTNHGLMSANTGFHFDTAPPIASWVRHRAVNFFNDGTIESGVDTNGTQAVLTFLLGTGGARTFVDADNIQSPGEFNLGFETLLQLNGDGISLNHGTVNMLENGLAGGQGFLFFNQGFLDGYWALGTNVMDPFVQFEIPPALEPPSLVTNRDYSVGIQQLGGVTYQTYVNDFTFGSNRVVQAVFLNNTNVDITNRVFFAGDIIVEWSWMGRTNTDYLYLFDEFGITTNFQLFINGNAGGRFTYQPFNYFFFLGGPFNFGPAAPQLATVPPGTFDDQFFTNQYSAYEALFQSTTRGLRDLPESSITNTPGRVEINANNYLDLDHARISSDNYIKLAASNHFGGSVGSEMVAPFYDLYLRVTNGTFYVTNVVPPTVPHPEGTIELYSARWTNVVNSITNTFHVLFVDTQLARTSETRQRDVQLQVTNYVGGSDSLVLNDTLHVTHSFLLDANRITIETNDSSSLNARGGLVFENTSILWPNSTPRLQYFTNHGFFITSNAVFFGGARTLPYYNTTFNEPYLEFINTGDITNHGSLIWAVDFFNTGNIDAGIGSIDLQQAHTALLTNGIFTARSNSISVASDNLFVSNHLFEAGAAITLAVAQALDDGSLACNSADNVTNKNYWTTGNGFNLTNRPVSGSLLATTVSNSARAFQVVPNRWAGADLGCSPAGFANNSAVGHIILDGGTNSIFRYSAVSGNNAIYVDYLDLRDWTTNEVNNNFIGIQIDPNMKIYFAMATAGGVPASSKLDGANGGRFCWVKDYNCGFFSSTNIVYPDGSTNRVNTALAQDCNIDSNGNGIPNCSDPAPIPPPGACPCITPVASYPFDGSSTNGTGGGGGGNGGGSAGSSLPKLGFPAGSGSSDGPMFSLMTYHGLFYETNGVNAASSGYFSASTTAAKTLTAKVSIGGKTYAVSGRFDSTGQATIRVPRGALRSLNLHLQIDPSGGDQIRGTVSDGQWTANLLADRAGFSRLNKFSDTPSTFTLTIPGVSNPSGHSFGSVKVGVDGSVQFSGSLGDGTKVTQQSALSAAGIWPLYIPLYGGSGCLLSWVQVTNNANLSGDVVWIKPSATSAKYYPSGFTNQMAISGLPYHVPAAHTRVLDLNAGDGQLLLYSPSFSGALTNDFTLDLNNRVTDLSGNQLKLTITPATGLFRGTVLNPNTGKPLQFQGALFEDWNSGFGYFLGPSDSGQVYLGPTP